MKTKMPHRKKMIAGLFLMAVGGGMFLIGEPADSQALVETTRAIDQVANTAPVTVFFWYGCPHCKNLEQAFIDQDITGKVRAQLGREDAYEKVPAIVNDLWELHARLYFALKKHGFSDHSHLGMMNQIQAHQPTSVQSIQKMLDNHALSSEKKTNPSFTATPQDITKSMYSPSVNRQIEEAVKKTNDAKLHGVPTILVNSDRLVELGGSIGYQNAGEIVLSILGQSDDK